MTMPDPEDLTRMVEQAEVAEGDRYPTLVGVHDALRAALAETDSDPAAAGR
jgi:hypothetical protein